MSPSGLPPEDLDRLRSACGHAVEPGRSLFAADSVTWRVNREAVVLLGGGRALLLQVAHPLVAAGVAAYSQFRLHPLRRLQRTLDLMLTLVFADAAHALAAVREIERVHAQVHGVLPDDVGRFAAGTPYDARDPALLLWVFATLVDTALLVYERFVEPLEPAARAAYYEESKVSARLLGVPETVIPPTLGSFEAYVERMLGDGSLAVGAAGREIARAVLRPPLPLGLGNAFRPAHFFTAGLLPRALRAQYGLQWSGAHESALRALALMARVGLPIVPGAVRLMPHARRAAAGEAAAC